MRVAGKLALVSGASSGIGAAVAKQLAQQGARVILLARNEAKLKSIASEINQSGGEASYYVVDLSDAEALESTAKLINIRQGNPDILINNAGSGRWKFLQDTSSDECWKMMEVPYFSTVNLTRAFLPSMLHRNSGHIVNISSVASRFVWPGATCYIAARWAVRGFTEALRADLHGKNIGVTLYESGVVESEYWQHNPGSRERVPKIAKMIPNLKPEYVGKAVVKGIEQNKNLIVIPMMMKLIYLQHSLFPGIVQWLMTVTGFRRTS